MNTILMGAPISEEEEILPEYLDYIYKLNYPKDKISIVWILNNSVDNSGKILGEFKSKYYNKYKLIRIIDLVIPEVPDNDRTAECRMGGTDRKGNKIISCCDMMAIGKKILQEFIGEEKYFFYIEADVLLKDPETLNKLISLDKDVIGLLTKTSKDRERYNILQYKNFRFEPLDDYIKFILKLKDLYKVDYISGDVLFKAKLFKELRFSKGNGGEDGFAMLELIQRGIKVWVDPTIENEHRM